MACCGQSVRGASAHPLSANRGTEKGPVLFEYRGTGSLTVFGRTTGRRYHFPTSGARLHVDGRDASVLEIMRGLEVIHP
jgi:hypothetical protein